MAWYYCMNIYKIQIKFAYNNISISEIPIFILKRLNRTSKYTQIQVKIKEKMHNWNKYIINIKGLHTKQEYKLQVILNIISGR